MSQLIETACRTGEADEVLALYRNVKMDADGKWTYADATDDYFGTTERQALETGADFSIRQRSAQGSRKGTASGAITCGAPICAANDGKLAASGSIPVGYAMATAADGDVFEWMPVDLPDNWMPTAAAQSLSGAGAINLTSYLTKFTSTGAGQALTLANGTRFGQLKKIQHIVDGGSGVLTPTSLSGGTTVTFTAAGDFALLKWNGAAWVAIELGNDADGATAATLA